MQSPSSSYLRLNDPINGHRAIRAGLERGVDHGTGILTQNLTVIVMAPTCPSVAVLRI